MEEIMKKGFFRLLIFVSIFSLTTVKAQMIASGGLQSSINGQNPFIDASTSFDTSVSNNSIGKGLVFPRTNLTTWEFNIELLNNGTFPTAFDGMVVYNTGTGLTLLGQGKQVYVEPGLYFFFNPNATTDISLGAWSKFGINTSIVQSP